MGGVVGEVRIGGVALNAVNGQPPGQTAAPADLDHVAKRRGRGRLADEAGIERLAARGQPFEHSFGAVDPRPFLVPGDQQADRAGKAGGSFGKPALDGGDEGGDRALHVNRTAAPQRAVAQARGERVERPGLARPRRHHVGVPGKAQIGPPLAKAGIEVDDRVAAVAAEHQAVAGETEVFEISGDDRERALVFGGDARPADQLGGECRRVDGGISHSRSNSLIAVLARVCASTVLTITAQ